MSWTLASDSKAPHKFFLVYLGLLMVLLKFSFNRLGIFLNFFYKKLIIEAAKFSVAILIGNYFKRILASKEVTCSDRSGDCGGKSGAVNNS